MSMNLASRVNILGVGITASNIPDVLGVMDQWNRTTRKALCLCRRRPFSHASAVGSAVPRGAQSIRNHHVRRHAVGLALQVGARKGRKNVSMGQIFFLPPADTDSPAGRRHFFYGGAPGVAGNASLAAEVAAPLICTWSAFTARPSGPWMRLRQAKSSILSTRRLPTSFWVGLSARQSRSSGCMRCAQG